MGRKEGRGGRRDEESEKNENFVKKMASLGLVFILSITYTSSIDICITIQSFHLPLSLTLFHWSHAVDVEFERHAFFQSDPQTGKTCNHNGILDWINQY